MSDKYEDLRKIIKEALFLEGAYSYMHDDEEEIQILDDDDRSSLLNNSFNKHNLKLAFADIINKYFIGADNPVEKLHDAIYFDNHLGAKKFFIANILSREGIGQIQRQERDNTEASTNINFEKTLDNLLSLEVDFYKSVKLDVSQILFLVLTFEKYKSLIENTKYNKNKLFKNNVEIQQFLKEEDDQSPLVGSTDGMQNKLKIVEEILMLIRKYVKIDIVNGSKRVSRGDKAEAKEVDAHEYRVRKVENDKIQNLFTYFSTSAGHVFEYLVFDALSEQEKVERPDSYYNNVYPLYVYFMIKRHGSFASNLNTYIKQITTKRTKAILLSKKELLEYFERNFLSGGIDEMDSTFYKEQFESKESNLIVIKNSIIDQIKDINPLFSEDDKYQFVTHEKSGDTYDVNIKYDDNVVFQFDIKTATTGKFENKPTRDGIHKPSYASTLRDKDFIGYGILTVDVEEDLNEHYVYKLKRFAGGGITKGFIRDNLDKCFVGYKKDSGKDTSSGGVLKIDSIVDQFKISRADSNDFYRVNDQFGIEIDERVRIMSDISQYFKTYILQNPSLKSKLGLIFNNKKYYFKNSNISDVDIRNKFEEIITSGEISPLRHSLSLSGHLTINNFGLSNFYKIYKDRDRFPSINEGLEELFRLIQKFVIKETLETSSHNIKGNVISENNLRSVIRNILREGDKKKSYSGSHPEESYGWSAKEEDFMFDKRGITTWKEDRQWVKEYLKSMGLLAKK